MGINYESAKFMLYAQRKGVSFKQTAMIGRQGLMMAKSELVRAFGDFQFDLSIEQATTILQSQNGFAEPLFEQLGAHSVASFDNSAYEQATEIWDMNQTVPADYHQRYSVVLDGGSLEHVFNFPVALKNCMEMVRVGGHFLSITPANNLLGHGFYQFSPELFFRVFTAQNGFELISVIAGIENSNCRWYKVTDPNTVKRRVTLVNNRPVYLMVIAKRVADVPIFAATPQQSDYVASWENGEVRTNLDSQTTRSSAFAMAKTYCPDWMKQKLVRTYQRMQYGFNRKHYQRVRPEGESS